MADRKHRLPSAPARLFRWRPLHWLLACHSLACNGTPHQPAPSPSAPHQTPSASEATSAPAPSAPAPAISLPAPAPAVPSPPSAAVTVAAIGDSLTDARSGGGGYLAYLRKRCPKSRFDDFGVGGEMVNQMRARFERDVFGPGRPEYTHLIVFGGVNDLYSDLTAGRVPSKISRDLGWMYATAKARGVRVVALTVAPWGGFSKYHNERRAAATLELNAWIEGQLQTSAVDHVVDTHALLRCGDPWKLCAEYARPFRDGLHFGPLGHEKLGQALFEQVFAGCR